jgi:peroxiredoxin
VQRLIIAIFSVGALITGIGVYHSQQYDFQTLNGESYQWQALRGQWIVVNYFAEWCAPCLQEVPELNNFYTQYAKPNSINLFAVSYDSLPATEVFAIRDKYNMQFPLLNPEKSNYIPIQKPQYLPATYVISPDGRISQPLLGEQTSASLINAVQQLKQAL